MSNPYYTVTGAPTTQSRGYSATIRSEYSLINTGFDAVYVAMLLRGLKGGETWTGTHVFTGATVTFATQSALDNSTKAATTAYADSAVAASAVTLNASIALKADIASPTFTGTPAAPTAAAGTATTQIATTAFVSSTAFSAALPSQTGNSGKFVTTDGTNASWSAVLPSQTSNSGKFLTTNGTAASWGEVLPSQTSNSGKFLTTNGTSTSWVSIGISRSTRTSNTILASSDFGTLIDITSGTFTQTFTAAATLGSGWYCYIRNSGTGVITLDPNASETIDGSTTFTLNSGESALVQCDGSNFYTSTRHTQSGLVLLGSITPTAVATISALNIFSSAYDNYLIVGTNITASATDTLRMRLAVGGVDQNPGSGYFSTNITNGAFSTNSASMNLGATFYSSRTGCRFEARLLGMNDATSAKGGVCTFVYESAANTYFGGITSLATNLTSAISGFSLLWSSASNFGATGIIEIYGYNKKVGAI